MTATGDNRPARAPLQPYLESSSSRLHYDSLKTESINHWKDHIADSESLLASSFTEDQRAVLESSSVKSEHAKRDPIPKVPQKGYTELSRVCKRLLLGVSVILNFCIFVVHNYPLLSIIIPIIPISTIRSSGLCHLSLFSSGPLCSESLSRSQTLTTVDTTPVGETNALWADFSSLTDVQKSLSDYFAGEGPGASELAIKIAKAELATSDLVVAVRFSTLRMADELADSLTTFVHDASDAGDSLQDLDAKAMGAIDSILNVNIWALKAIEEAQAPVGVLSALSLWKSKKTTEEIVNENFNEAMRTQDKILSRLITQAKASQGDLKRMKERLQAIRDLATKENMHINVEHGELLSSMWTALGSNKQDLQRYQTNLELLVNLEKFTDVAKTHIAQALTNLKTMQAQMKDLRARVSQPDIAGTNIPVNVHVRTIMDGIQRMKEGRIRARARESDIRTVGAY